MTMPLEGIRILEWASWFQGPLATSILADLGAEVIKIEERVSGDPVRGFRKERGMSMMLPGGRQIWFEYGNRNKKGITLDLKKEKGREVVYRLVQRWSDVFVQAYRKGAAARIGLDYETLCQYNPKLIYATASGYGSKGPDSEQPAFDYIGLARSGIASLIGEPDDPQLRKVGGLADEMGGIALAHGILAAIVARERFGIGQEIDSSILGGTIWLQGIMLSIALFSGQEYPRTHRKKTTNPIYNHYKCSDGKWLALALIQSDRHWPSFCRLMGIEELEKDPRFENADKREENCEKLISVLDELFIIKPRDEWVRILRQNKDFILAPVNSLSDLASDPQVLENEYIVDFDHPVLGPVKVVGGPVKFSKTPWAVRSEAPEFGQHTEEVLLEVGGYTWEEIAELKEKEVI